MNQTIAGKYPVFGVSYISPSFLRFSRAGSTGRRCGWLGSRSQPAGETVDPSAVNPQEEPGTIVIGYGPVGRTLTRLLRENKLNPTVIDLNYDSVQSLRRGSGRAMARTGLRMMPTSPSPSLKFRTAGFPGSAGRPNPAAWRGRGRSAHAANLAGAERQGAGAPPPRNPAPRAVCKRTTHD